MLSMSHVDVLFFLQAEDGIRDLTVTGVQTCALPISPRLPWGDRLLEPLQDVRPEPRLVIVHEHGRRDVHGAYEYESLLHAARAHLLDHLIGDVEDLLAALGGEREIMRVALHEIPQDCGFRIADCGFGERLSIRTPQS